MKAEFYKDQIARVLDMVEQKRGDEAEHSESLPVAQYLDPERLEQEKAMFRRLPLIIGHSSEITDAGDFIVRDRIH